MMKKTKSQIPKNNALLYNAIILRKDLTKQEKHLWYDFLKKYPIKIYKQRIIGNYIADFYCASAKLVIELDGGQHRTQDGKQADTTRDKYMESIGLKVLRFSNYSVDSDFLMVCDIIDKEIKERLDSSLKT